MKRLYLVGRTLLGVALSFAVASVAVANHDTDCEISGGTNGPNQLDCTLPTFVATVGSTNPQTSKFVYTPSTDFNPVTCAVGSMSVDPSGQWLNIDTTVLDTQSPPNFQEVEVTIDPSGLAEGTYDGSVLIALTPGIAPNCPSNESLNGTVSVRLVVVPPAVPSLSPLAALMLVLGLGGVAVRQLRPS